MSFEFIVLLCTIHFVTSQGVPQPLTPPPPFEGASFGDCDEITDMEISRLISEQLKKQLFRETGTHVGFHTLDLTAGWFKVTCLSYGTTPTKFSSVSVAAHYLCIGLLCRPNSGGNLHNTHFSFKCLQGENVWGLYADDEPGFNEVVDRPRFNENIRSVRTRMPGTCYACYNVAAARINHGAVKNTLSQCLGM